MADLTFELVTPEGLKFSEEVAEVMLPTPDGQIAVLPQHMPLVSLATAGAIVIRRHLGDADNALEHYATSGGVVEVDGRRVRLLADSAEHADDIDEIRAKQALEAAQALQRSSAEDVEIAEATALIERNMARVKVAGLRRRQRNR